MARSIQEKGLLQPLIVRALSNGKYEVISGQRRLMACKRIGLNPIPCRQRDDLGDMDAVTVSLIENVQRADLNPIDKAEALKNLHDQYLSYDRVAREVSLTVQTVRKYIRLLSLPEKLKKRVATGNGAVGIGALSQLAESFKDSKAAIEAHDKIAGFSGRIQTEILKRSGGDIEKLDDLVWEAQEGAFDTRQCGGSYGCDIIRSILEGEMTQSDFQGLVRDTADRLSVNVGKAALRSASREFWKALAAE